jgi:hypothetical protein
MHRPKPSKPRQLRDPCAHHCDQTSLASHTSAPTIELTWALMLGSARNLVAESTSLRGRRADTNRRKGTRKAADRENCRRATVRYAATPGAKADAVFLERSDHLSNSGPDGAVFFTDGSILVDGKTWIGKGSYLCRIVHHMTERPIVPMQLDFEVA